MNLTEDEIIGWSNGSQGRQEGNTLGADDAQEKHAEYLDECHNFREVFNLVKRSVKASLNLERTGLMLFLADMPYTVGAYHQIGTNNIVMNRILLDHVLGTAEATTEANSFIYSILTHEYLHALGYVDEAATRELTYRVSRETFGDTHLATRMAASNPWQYIKPPPFGVPELQRPASVVRDFEPPPFGYIS